MTRQKREPKMKPLGGTAKGARVYFIARCTAHDGFLGATGQIGERHLFGARSAAEAAIREHVTLSHIEIETIRAIVRKRTTYDVTEVQ